MLIINADDWGGWKTATDAALACYEAGRITSASAMVFMEDSERAAELAAGLKLDVGLHVNLDQMFSRRTCPVKLAEQQERIRRFLNRSRYASLLYHPGLRAAFRYVYQAQESEFVRLYGRAPTHIDGHRHRHLCANMLFDGVMPAGSKVRRNFSYFPGEKGILNRAYRRWVDGRLARRFRTTDYFFALSQNLSWQRLARVAELARTANVEIMTHPEKPDEFAWLMSEEFSDFAGRLCLVDYAGLS